MRLILMGTGPFALPTFQSLLESDHDLLAVVTRPVPPPHGRRKGPANPVLDWATRTTVPVLVPADVNQPQCQRELAALQPDLLVVCDFGQILAATTLGVAPLGGINLHGSLLPKYRGAAPINWAIWKGETETGVTVIHMTPQLDAGPCLASARVAIGGHEDAVELEPRLSQLGVEPVLQSIRLLESWDGVSTLGVIQDTAHASSARRLRKTDGRVDWSQSAEQIHNQVRALKPWPGTDTQWMGPKGPVRLILDQVAVAPPDAAPSNSVPGKVVRSEKQLVWVGTGHGVLEIRAVKPAGKRVMGIAEFLRGHVIAVDDQFE